MSAQSETLRLAEILEGGSRQFNAEAAAELRRLSAENEAFGIHLSERMKDLALVEAQRDALLEALRGVMSVMPTLPKDARHIVDMEDRYKEDLVAARAAIKKAEGA